MKIFSSPTMKHLDNILSYLQSEELKAMRACNHDSLAAYHRVFRYVADMYSKKVIEWERRHPLSAMIRKIKCKRTEKRFRKLTNEIRGIWV